MLDKPEYIHNIIIDHLSSTLNEKDEAFLYQWISESDDNKKVFEQSKEIWNTKEIINELDGANWDKFSAVLKRREKKHYRFEKQWLAIAATMLILVAAGWFLHSLSVANNTLQTSSNDYITDTLENGCVVYLYPSSELTPKNQYFSQNKQEYSLKGEAFFVVPKTTENDVVITIGDAQIRVKGTSFRVSSCDKKKAISVMVESGRVELTKKSDPLNQLMIQAGEQGYYSCTNHEMWKQEKSESIYLIYQPENIKTNEPITR